MWTQVLEWTRNCQLQSLLLNKATSWEVSEVPDAKVTVGEELRKVIDLVLEHLRRGSNNNGMKNLTIGGILLSEPVLESIISSSTNLEFFGFCFAGRDLVSHVYFTSEFLEIRARCKMKLLHYSDP